MLVRDASMERAEHRALEQREALWQMGEVAGRLGGTGRAPGGAAKSVGRAAQGDGCDFDGAIRC